MTAGHLVQSFSVFESPVTGLKKKNRNIFNAFPQSAMLLLGQITGLKVGVAPEKRRLEISTPSPVTAPDALPLIAKSLITAH